MKNQGFTLIELLVVVLIIGILAAIAVPKYQVAVKVSKVKSALSVARSIYNAEQVYYLANGRYTKEVSELDLSLDDITASSNIGNFVKVYTVSWGEIVLYDAYPTSVLQIDGITVDFWGPLKKPGVYGQCYGNDEVCSKFGRLRFQAGTYGYSTNVYYMIN